MAEHPVIPIRAHPEDPLRRAPAPPSRDRAIPDEERLWARALRDRDETAFARLLDRYYPAMLRLAMIHVRSRAQAEEVVQDTWLAALRGIHRFAGRSSLKTWVFRILLNRARSCGAREARVIPFSAWDRSAEATDAPSRPSTFAAPAEQSPECRVLARELRAQIERAIAKLPPAQREVITLRDVDGWSAAETCAALAISEANQRVLLHRARVGVRAALARYLFEPTDAADVRASGM